jgi:hypothetical protein
MDKKKKPLYACSFFFSSKIVFGNASAAAVNKKAVLHLFG